jgi:hypothetical protein
MASGRSGVGAATARLGERLVEFLDELRAAAALGLPACCVEAAVSEPGERLARALTSLVEARDREQSRKGTCDEPDRC